MDNRLAQCKPLEYESWAFTPTEEPLSWISKALKTQEFLHPAIVLGSADDGVIWGTWSDHHLHLARDSQARDTALANPLHLPVGACLRVPPLQSLRVFNPAGEFRVWRRSRRNATGQLETLFEACFVVEPSGENDGTWAYCERRYALLGEPIKDPTGSYAWLPAENEAREFLVLRGKGGEFHAPPWKDPRRKPYFRARHYYQQTSTGLWQQRETRWLDLMDSEEK